MISRTQNVLEPLLVPTLRLLVALPLAIILLQLMLGYLLPLYPLGFVRPQTMPYVAVLPVIVSHAFTLLLLGIPRLAAWLGRWFLPITLFTCTVGPESTFLLLMIRFQGNSLGSLVFPDLAFHGLQAVVPMLFFLTIPLIVTAWQYSFRQVLFYALSLLVVDVSVGVLVKLFGGVDVVWTLLQFAIGRATIFCAIGYLVSRLVASQRQQRAALAHANEQLTYYALTQEQLTISRERNRMARDLHDTLAHYMSGLVLELEGTRLHWNINPEQARTTLDQAITTARNGLRETRGALRSLRSTPLVDLGLTGALGELAQSMAERNQWHLQLALPATPPLLLPATDEVFYRVVQEALTNVERHAGAKNVTMAMRQDASEVSVLIEDDGCGFDPTKVNQPDAFGLLGMQERSGLIGGELAVESSPGRGTKVRFRLTERGEADAPEAVAKEPPNEKIFQDNGERTQ